LKTFFETGSKKRIILEQAVIRRKSTHPGEILLEDVIKPLGTIAGHRAFSEGPM